MSNNRGQVTGRLGGTQGTGTQSEARTGWADAWLPNFAVGFVGIAALAVLFELTEVYKNAYQGGFLLGLLAWFAAAVASEFLPFKHRVGWQVVGAILAGIIVMPLVITMPCDSWHWGNKCRAVHTQHHTTQVR